MRFANNPPEITTDLDREIQELIEEFEYLLYCERLAEAYREQKPPENP